MRPGKSRASTLTLCAMKVKTITGPSIHAALAEARRLLGDDVVLLESVPPNGSDPARISVLADDPAPASPARAVRQPASDHAPPAARGYGYGVLFRPPEGAASTEENTLRAERFSPPQEAAVQTLPGDDGPSAAPASPERSGPGRGRLFPEAPDTGRTPLPPADVLTSAGLERLFAAQIQTLHERLDRMERRFDSAVIGASQRWTAHPLFAALLKQGLRPSTVASLFDSLAAQGHDPDMDPVKLQWVLAHTLRDRLAVDAPKQSTGTQMFIGPSGAGKTSLALKLARHPSFYARRKTTVIVILPEADQGHCHQSPVDLYRHAGLPVQSVETEEEMQQALGRLEAFDQVLIDTPSLPMTEGGARKMLQRIRRMVDSLMPLEVHFVLNATRALESLEPDFLKRLPLAPGVVALTHLDETPCWGRVAEWLATLALPVQFVSTGPRVPDDLSGFSSTWFVEAMMKL